MKLKSMVISRLNELENVLYITRNLRISTFNVTGITLKFLMFIT